MVKIDVNATYRLVNLRSGTSMAISEVDNASVIGEETTSKPDQLWKFVSAGQAHVYYIKSVAKNHYLSPIGNDFQNGKQLQVLADRFQWVIEDVPDMGPVARIKVATHKKYVDLDNGQSEEGARVQLYDLAPPDAVNDQFWVLEKDL